LLSSSPFYRCTIIRSSLYGFFDYVAWSLQIKLFINGSLFIDLFSFILDKYLKIGFLECMVGIYVYCFKKLTRFSIVAVPFQVPGTTNSKFYLLHIWAILISVQYYCPSDLDLHFPMTDNVEHLFLCLLPPLYLLYWSIYPSLLLTFFVVTVVFWVESVLRIFGFKFFTGYFSSNYFFPVWS
jgi:hypothetical protein